jgi:hypothetical protein
MEVSSFAAVDPPELAPRAAEFLGSSSCLRNTLRGHVRTQSAVTSKTPRHSLNTRSRSYECDDSSVAGPDVRVTRILASLAAWITHTG